MPQTISRCFGYDDLGQYGLKWLQNNFLGEILQERNIELDIDRNIYIPSIPKTVSEEELSKYRYYHPYMYKRKLTDEIIEKFDVGYDETTRCITFPVKDEKGHCLFIARRSVDYKYFNYPQSVEKPVYGLYELKCLSKYPNEIYICESIINALTIWTYGKYAVALNGTGTKYQYDQLKRIPCRKLILALDPDNAGRKGMQKLYHELKNYKMITFLKGIPEGKDINDLSFEDFKKCYEIF